MALNFPCHGPSGQDLLSRRGFLKYGFYSGLALGLWLNGCGRRRGDREPNILLITLDTTRADRLGCYGYARSTTPNLDILAEDSILYTRAIAPSSWTLPSHASLFTGKFTSSHGAGYDAQGPLRLSDAVGDSKSWQQYRVRGLGREELTLARILAGQGYLTGAVVAGPWLKRVFGLDNGFDEYDDENISSTNGRIAFQVTEQALRWIRRAGREKFFLFLNYFDPHGPYLAPEGYLTHFFPEIDKEDRTQKRNAMYDAEIQYMDHYIGKLLNGLQERGLYDNTWIIVTADHGELLGEHGVLGHGEHLYQEELHVPLLMKPPKGEGLPARIDEPVQLVDIFPLICQRVAAPVPSGIQGAQPPAIGHLLVAETYPLPSLSQEGEWRALYAEDFKLLWNSKGNHLLYNLQDDPREEVNLFSQETLRADTMMKRLNTYLSELPRPAPDTTGPRMVDEETRKALKSLGYL